jgi:selenocysteine-specific elongation factor
LILGTAGHIDHGKTALVKALTGVDTDRLPEEQRRGITIELGFAPLALPGIGVVGVVDVPGHEAFVRTMVAGATGVDVALLVVAADEGVMPQTREHAAILDLLGVQSSVVALTKSDLVDDPDWMQLVEDDVRSLLAPTSLSASPIHAVSARTGAGIEELLSGLALCFTKARPRNPDDVFRLWVDRAFTVKGTGTVVTGTVESGAVEPEAMVHAFPSRRSYRVRGVQSHGESVSQLGPGSRGAIALGNADIEHVSRGTVLVSGDPVTWPASRVLRADVQLTAGSPPLRPRTRVRFHVGTVETGARVVTYGGGISPGEEKAVRIVLDEELVLRGGDRFVLRGGSPHVTIGGGTVTDPSPPFRRARPWEVTRPPASLRLSMMLGEADSEGVALALLPMRLGLPVTELGALLDAPDFVRVADVAYSRLAVEKVTRELVRRITEHHERNPLDHAAPLQEIRARAPGAARLLDFVVGELVASGAVVVEKGGIRLSDWRPRLDDGLRDLQAAIESALREAGAEPPSVSDLTAAFGRSTLPLLRLMAPEKVVQVEQERYYHVTAVETLVACLRTNMRGGREYSPAELREVLGISRKYLIPFLEYCDRLRVTERRGDGRVLCS